MIVVGFIRHGITQWNKEGRTQGSIDIPLDEEGISMAKQLANYLENDKWDVIYSSPLQRARQTAEMITGGKAVHVDERLREVGEGKKEGTTEAERIEKWGPTWRNLSLNAETTDLVQERIWSFIESLKEHHANERILVVSHGSFIEQVIQLLCPVEKDQQEIHNASLTIISLNGTNECLVYNCTCYLQG